MLYESVPSPKSRALGAQCRQEAVTVSIPRTNMKGGFKETRAKDSRTFWSMKGPHSDVSVTELYLQSS